MKHQPWPGVLFRAPIKLEIYRTIWAIIFCGNFFWLCICHFKLMKSSRIYFCKLISSLQKQLRAANVLFSFLYQMTTEQCDIEEKLSQDNLNTRRTLNRTLRKQEVILRLRIWKKNYGHSISRWTASCFLPAAVQPFLCRVACAESFLG